MIAVATSKDNCLLGWDPTNFLYTIGGLYLGDCFLLMIQINYVKSTGKDNLCVMFLRYVLLYTLVGFQIKGNVDYY